MRCPGCGNEIKDDAKFCKYCGRPVERLLDKKELIECVLAEENLDVEEKIKCPACGKLVKQGNAFCTYCGASLSFRMSKKEENNKKSNKKTAGKRFLTVFLVVSFLSIIILVGAVALYYVKNKQEVEKRTTIKEDVTTKNTSVNDEMETTQLSENTTAQAEVSTSGEIGIPAEETSTEENLENTNEDTEAVEDNAIPDSQSEKEVEKYSVVPQIETADIKSEIQSIRQQYQVINDAITKKEISASKSSLKGVKMYLEEDSNLGMFEIPPNISGDNFTRELYFYKNENDEKELFFAFYYDHGWEQRLYFYNGQMFSWIDENKKQRDLAFDKKKYMKYYKDAIDNFSVLVVD